jgi:hypothetical protein
MSIFSDIGNAVSGAVSSLANIAATVAPVLFPQAALAMTATNLLMQATQGGVDQALSQLTKEAGMPKFLQSIVGDLAKDVLSKFVKPSNGDCDNAVRDRCGNDFRDFQNDLGRSIADIAKGIKKCDDDEGSSSWLVAIAKAMGRVAGEHMKKVSQLSDKLETLSADAGNKEQNAENAKQAGITTNELQGETQMVSLLQNAFSNALKSLGESLSTMARK